MSKFYITTAIDYPSGPPHLGHAYEKVMADVVARWHRLKGEDVFFLTGTDEHGQKIERKAAAEGKTPHEYVDIMSSQFKTLWEKLSISFNDFIRTTEERHMLPCARIFDKIYENGDIYKGKYKGLYCVECEGYYTVKELKDGNCPVHEKPVESVEEECYFFATSRYAKKVSEEIEKRAHFIEPKARRAEILNRLSEGLRDLCVSRSSVTWGIPLSMNKEHVMFVWFDALVNYLTGAGYPGGERFARYWPADVHIIGKDILWFHAVIWPAILMAIGAELPKHIFVHGFVNIAGEKLSKSKGVVVDPDNLIKRFGPDALRYFLMREIPSGEDGNFSEEAMVKRTNFDLANDLGNLLSRVLTMLEKFQGRIIPDRPETEKALDKNLKEMALGTFPKADGFISSFNIHKALEAIFELVRQLNQYVDKTAPWRLAGSDKKRLDAVLYNMAEGLRFISVLLSPFMPATSHEMMTQLDIRDRIVNDFASLKSWGLFPPGIETKKGSPLFPRIK
ncbi:MAG: methionine--tRNA ligase [Candidatus Omnitrophica bacterium]|nr:methionine--tRNA ligase [Candidatus Omnitrophota bacterium]